MASLPALPTFARMHRTDAPSSTELSTRADTKLTIARRLHAEDEARRTTSIPPPASRRRSR